MENGLVRMTIQITNRCSDLPLPSQATSGSSGFDLRAAVDEPLVLNPGKRALVPTGIRLAIPEGYEGQVRARSGLAIKHGIAMVNAPGTIDADYRGELAVILINLGEEPFEIRRGERIAQLVFAAVAPVTLQQVETLSETTRGEGGFGSSGKT